MLTFTLTVQAKTNQCERYFLDSISIESRIQNSNPNLEWAPQKNVFSDSFQSTVVSGLTWLTLVQLIKHQFISDKNQPIFTDAFWVTVPTDIMITIASHALSLKELPMLQKFMNGQFLGAKFEYFARTLSNTLFNSSVIVATWAVAGIDIHAGTIGAALGLCAAVYSVLQITKPFLFKSVPAKMGNKDFQNLKEKFPQVTQNWMAAAEELPLDSRSIENHFVYALDAVIYEIPFETRTDLFPEIRDQILKALKNGKTAQAKTLRRNLVSQLIQKYDALKATQEQSTVIEDILRLDSSITGVQSLEILRFLKQTHKQRQKWLYTASFLDQAIAVGIAGGVFLYSTTHWAMSGELPLFWNIILN